MKFNVTGNSKWTAKFKRHPKGPGGACGLRMESYEADLGCWNPFFFDKMGQPANCARAERSDRYKQGRVHIVFFQQIGNATGLLFHGHWIIGTHEGIVKVGHASYNAVL